VDAIRILDPQFLHTILSKEIDESQTQETPIIRVVLAIKAREQILGQIEQTNDEFNGMDDESAANQKDELIKKLSEMLIKLR
jgi:hypothetical protein